MESENANANTGANAGVDEKKDGDNSDAAPCFTVGVRYGLMLVTEHFVCKLPPDLVTGVPPGLSPGSPVIVRSARGVDWGEVASRPRPAKQAPRGLGELMRPARPEDLAVIRHIRDNKEPEEFRSGQEAIRTRKLPMRLVGVEHLFSGEKIVFYFIADGRVDFRELVKDLARRYRTRIEMRQIGVRDEARLLADYEHCGRELCCRTFIRHLEPVTMRMAKTQKTTLDPTKISGHCGRLMCCLRFEDVVYTEMQKEMPPRGAVVVTPHCVGEVINHDILRQDLLIVLSDGTRANVHISEVTEVRGRSRGGPGGSGGASYGAPGGPRGERGERPNRERGERPQRGGERPRDRERERERPAPPPPPAADAPESDASAKNG